MAIGIFVGSGLRDDVKASAYEALALAFVPFVASIDICTLFSGIGLNLVFLLLVFIPLLVQHFN